MTDGRFLESHARILTAWKRHLGLAKNSC